MARTFLSITSLLLVAFALAGCAHMSGGDGWVTLVDGETGLDNWNRIGDANWRAEALWCGSLECQYALSEVVAHHARLYDLAESRDSGSPHGSFAGR